MKRYGPRIRNSPIVQHLKHAVRTVVRTYPVLEPSARRLYLLFWRQKVRFRAAVQMRGIVDPNRTLQVGCLRRSLLIGQLYLRDRGGNDGLAPGTLEQ